MSSASGRAEKVKGAAADSEPAPLSVSTVFTGQGFAFKVTRAWVDRPQIKTMSDGETSGKEPNLLVSFEIRNTDDRKLLSFYPKLGYGDFIEAVDDVGNPIRSVSYDFAGLSLAGALRPGQDIKPGEAVSHVEAFEVPLPKTKFVTLSVEIKSFGRFDNDEKVRFTIPAQGIQRIEGAE